MRNRSFIVVLLMLLAVGVSMGQESRGTIVGRVTDAQNAVIPNASVQVVSTAMGTKLSLVTNDVGFYQASYLIPGMYQITVEAPGFKKSVRDGIEVRVTDRLEINITLEVGAPAESVTVTGGGAAAEYRHRLDGHGGGFQAGREPAAVLRQSVPADRSDRRA